MSSRGSTALTTPSTTARRPANQESSWPVSPTGPAPAAPAIRTHGLTKTYGSIHAVDGLTMQVPHGVVAGFVGPNGAGKTTTIRMLLSLIRPTAGSVEVLGRPSTHPQDYLPWVGALIEGPAFYPGLSARRNLEILAALGGCSAERVDPLLAQVGLHGRENDTVKTYSLGMRQRLGIAAALLSDPALLILDEPTNGLDPAGILEIRQLLQQLKEQGVTILVSSHLLSEVEQTADWIILLHQGKLVYQGWLEDLLERRQNALVVGATSTQELQVVAAVARAANYESKLENGYLRVLAPPEFAAQLNRGAMEAGVVLTELHAEHANLEETFFSLTNGGQQ